MGVAKKLKKNIENAAAIIEVNPPSTGQRIKL